MKPLFRCGLLLGSKICGLRACFDHTLITLIESVGIRPKIGSPRLRLECPIYDCIGRLLTGRNGFDSRWRYHGFIDLQALRSRFAHTISLFFYDFGVLHTGF